MDILDGGMVLVSLPSRFPFLSLSLFLLDYLSFDDIQIRCVNISINFPHIHKLLEGIIITLYCILVHCIVSYMSSFWFPVLCDSTYVAW